MAKPADSGSGASDPDTKTVLDVCVGATRSPQDPDTQLAALLPQIAETKDPQELLRILRGLILNAHSD